MMERTLNFFSPPRGIKGREVVIGIDPGVTTGLSVMVLDNLKNGVDGVMAWGSDQISYGGSGNVQDLYEGDETFPEQEIAEQIGQAIVRWSRWNTVYIACEDFIIRKHNSSRDFLAPVRITAGILQEIHKSAKGLRLTFQTPADAKGTCKDERMDAWGFPIKTQKDRHSRDADRHVILFLRRCQANPAHPHKTLQVPEKK